MPAIEPHAKATYSSQTEVDKDHVCQFVAEDVEIQEGRLAKAGEEPTRVQDETDGEVEEGLRAPELLPEGSALGSGEIVNLGIEKGDGGNGTERNESQGTEDAEAAAASAQFRLDVFRVRNGGLNGGQSPAPPDPLIGALMGASVGRLQRLAQSRSLGATVACQPRPLELQILSPPRHAVREIANNLENLKDFGSA